jgi:hypothetical protein
MMKGFAVCPECGAREYDWDEDATMNQHTAAYAMRAEIDRLSALNAELVAENERLRRCIASIEDELTRDPPRVGDALFVCEAARAEPK